MQAFVIIRENNVTVKAPVEYKEKPLWWQTRGLSFTASGYGARIPTKYMVKYNKKWRRVYCIVYSNSGTLFIGKKYNHALTVDFY